MRYTWNIESVDHETRTMVVQFVYGERAKRLNLQTPPAGEDPAAFIETFAPIDEWKASELQAPDVMPGTSGESTYVQPEPVDQPEAQEEPNTVGSVNEEYLRALIYQVLEEIRESTV